MDRYLHACERFLCAYGLGGASVMVVVWAAMLTRLRFGGVGHSRCDGEPNTHIGTTGWKPLNSGVLVQCTAINMKTLLKIYRAALAVFCFESNISLVQCTSDLQHSSEPKGSD